VCDLLVQQKTVARDPQTADGDVRTVSSYHGGRPSLSLCLRPKPKPKPKPNPITLTESLTLSLTCSRAITISESDCGSDDV